MRLIVNFPGMIMPVTELIEAQRDTKILNLAISETSSRLNQRKQDLSRILNLFKAGKKHPPDNLN